MKTLLMLGLLSVVCLIGCDQRPASGPIMSEGKIENIEKVFWKGRGSYAIVVPNKRTGELKTLFLDNVKHEVHVFPDAPKDVKPWVDVKPEGRGGKTFDLHIHDSSEILKE